MDEFIWIFCTIMAILCWTATSLLYKSSMHRNNEKHICLKYALSVGFVFLLLRLFICSCVKSPFQYGKVLSDFGR